MATCDKAANTVPGRLPHSSPRKLLRKDTKTKKKQRTTKRRVPCRKQERKSNETQNWFFGKIKKIDKLPAGETKGKREKMQNTNI